MANWKKIVNTTALILLPGGTLIAAAYNWKSIKSYYESKFKKDKNLTIKKQ